MAPRAPLLLLALLTTAALAGCAGDADDPGAGGGGASDGGNDGGVGASASPLAAAPTWQVGDYWTYQSPRGAVTYVVAEDAGSDYIMDSSDLESVFMNVRDPISTMGPQAKADLSGSQGSQRVQFFQWPTIAGASWTTTWDGEEREVTVKETTQSTATMEAVTDDVLIARYTYDADAKWFSSLAFYYGQDEPVWSLSLTESGSGWSGSLWNLDAQQLVDYSKVGQTNEAGRFGVGAPTDLWISTHFRCTAQGGYIAELRGPDGTTAPLEMRGTCPLDEQASQVVAPQEGDWSFVILGGDAEQMGFSSLQVWARTYEPVPFAS